MELVDNRSVYVSYCGRESSLCGPADFPIVASNLRRVRPLLWLLRFDPNDDEPSKDWIPAETSNRESVIAISNGGGSRES